MPVSQSLRMLALAVLMHELGQQHNAAPLAKLSML
jgi:hypothetical protein